MANRGLIKTPFEPALLEDFFKPWNEWFDNGGLFKKVQQMPAVNITENKDSYNVSLAAPGLKKDDFNIDIQNNILTIGAEKEEDKTEDNEKISRREYNYTSFSRSFTLPEEVNQEAIEASYTDGVLKLRLPRKEEVKNVPASKRIAVK